jgi:two-component system LytT family response regulator
MNHITTTPKNYIHVGGRRHVKPEEVMMLVANVNYTTIHLVDGERFMIAKNIGKVQETLQNYGHFVRPNKGQVVNFAYVLENRNSELLLQNNEIVKFSRRQSVKNKIKK